MNQIHNIATGVLMNEWRTWEPMRPISLDEKIKTLRGVIASMEPYNFNGKAESLAAKRAALKALEEKQDEKRKIRSMLNHLAAAHVTYSLFEKRRGWFVMQIEKHNEGERS